MQLRTRSVLAAATAVAVVGGITSCASPAEQSAGDTRTLTLAVQADFSGWDPVNAIGAGSAIWMESAAYDRLFNCDEVGELQPNVAETWEFNDAQTELTVHVRPDMTFSDGTPVDAAAVEASIEAKAADPKGGSRLGDLTVDVVDDLTAVISVAEPNPALPTWLCVAEGTIYNPQWLADADYSAGPGGSGPYLYDAQASTGGSEYRFTKNPDNWAADEFPYDELVIKVITDPTATINALKTGQVDGAATEQATRKEVESAGLSQLELQGTFAGLLITDREGTLVPALGDADVRRAINMVFDRETIATTLYDGTAEPTSQIFRTGTAAYIEDLDDPYPFNVETAKKLIADAGFADGFDVEIPYVAGFGWEKEMPVIIEQLAELNIRATQTTLTGPNAISELISGRFPLVFWPLGNFGNSLVDIQNTIDPEGVWNLQNATDPVVADLLAQLATTGGDEATQLQQELNRHVIEQAWFAPWVYPTTYFSYDSDAVTVDSSSDINGLVPNLRDLR